MRTLYFCVVIFTVQLIIQITNSQFFRRRGPSPSHRIFIHIFQERIPPFISKPREPEFTPIFRPDFRPDFRPESRPDFRPESRPDFRPESRPDFRPESRPDFRPESRPDFRPELRPVTTTELTPIRIPFESFPNILERNFDNNETNQQSCVTPEGGKGICKEYIECADLYHSLPMEVHDWHIFKCWINGKGERKPNGLCCPATEDDFRFTNSLPEIEIEIETITLATTTTTTSTTAPVSTTEVPTTTTTPTTTTDSIIPQESFNEETKSEENDECKYDTVQSSRIREQSGNFSIQFVSSFENIMRQNTLNSFNTASDEYFGFYRRWEKSNDLSKFAHALVYFSREISNSMKFSKSERTFDLVNLNITTWIDLNQYCQPTPTCSVSKYRTLDGSCNNMQIPREGQSLTPFYRLLPPDYSDGLIAPRASSTCLSLPNARDLSRALIKDREITSSDSSLYFSQMGQFIASDLAASKTELTQGNAETQCCHREPFLPDELQNVNCIPLEIHQNDPLFDKDGQNCINFIRAPISPSVNCRLGYADQTNFGTHWMDLSNLYGSDVFEASDLRLFRNGLMKYSRGRSRKQLLPLSESSEDGCTLPHRGIFCFQTGDPSVNKNMGLLVTQLLWFREHNRVASQLKFINEEWSDEELYQEARRIVIAEYQHIIYNEWIPILLGRNDFDQTQFVQKFNLPRVGQDGLFSNKSGSVSNEFSSAAFRLDISLKQDIIKLINEAGKNDTEFLINLESNNPNRIRLPGQIDKWITHLSRFPTSRFDSRNVDLENTIRTDSNPLQLDTSSWIIERSRDAGLPGYNFYRELCHGKKVKRFEEMDDLFSEEVLSILKEQYEHVDDVDLWVGGMLEKPAPGQFVGPTFACIIREQFFRSKRNDAFFYDMVNQLHSFSKGQLSEIRKASFARILCDNGDSIKEVQPSVFMLPDDKTNFITNCSEGIPVVDLRQWKNEPTPSEATASSVFP